VASLLTEFVSRASESTASDFRLLLQRHDVREVGAGLPAKAERAESSRAASAIVL
jgi:hypothetical protein